MARKQRGNDAIPSWSGFNYQGKVMLLYVLLKINELSIKGIHTNYSVELETREDFVIINDGKSESFHQVKAVLSKSKWSSHSTALNKLLQHRNNSDNPTGACYFMTAKEISDWTDTANTYSANITLFNYLGKTVSVCDVKDYILREIKNYTTNSLNISTSEEAIYGELCLFLDQKIAVMHKQGAKKRNYIIPFSDFKTVIIESVGKQRAREEYYLKERVYEYTIETLQKALDTICANKCSKQSIMCEISCGVKSAYEQILGLPDLVKYCKVINPSKKDGWDNILKLVESLPEDPVRSEILTLFKESQTPDKVDADSNTIFLHSKFCKASKKCIIPTLLNLSAYFQYGELSLQETFQNIKNNTDIINVLDGNAITAIPGGYNGILTQAQITSGWTEYLGNQINNFDYEIEIVSGKELLDIFIAEGGNHD